MRSQRLLLALLLSVLLAGSACALRIHTIGARSPAHPDPMSPEAGFCVVKSPDADDSDLDAELTRKIEALLALKGFSVATSADAAYYLFYDYRIRSMMARMRLDFISGSQTGMETVRREGPFIHTVALRVVDATAFRDEGREAVIWQGGAVMNEVPTEGTRFTDMVLVAAFEQFNKETTETATVKMRRNDPRVRQLSR